MSMRKQVINWESLTNSNVITASVNLSSFTQAFTHARNLLMIIDEEISFHRKMDLRTERYNVLRNDDKLTLGEINAQLAEDGFDEITAGAGLVCLPTKQHKILWEGKGVRKMIAS
jgi:hypothetical protein